MGGWKANVSYTLNTTDRPAVVYAVDCKGANGTGAFTEDIMPTLISDPPGKAHAVAYRMCSVNSGAWQSDNPEIGCYETDVACTLDGNTSPACNQGGVFVVSADCSNGTIDPDKTCTLQAKPNGGRSLNCMPILIFDARGNGEGGVSPTLTGDHQDRITDYTALVVSRKQDSDGSENPKLQKPFGRQ